MVMNGDMGYIRHIKETNTGIVWLVSSILVWRDLRALYEHLLLGYAISTHRAKVREQAVMLLPAPCTKGFLSSNLLYVADSRAKEQLIEIGDIETIKECLKRQ